MNNLAQNVQSYQGLMLSMADELTASYQVAHGLALMSVMSAVATVGQDLVDVELPNLGVVPTSLSTLVVAGSGEGKSVVDRAVFRVLREYDLKKKAEQTTAQQQMEADTESWKVTYKVLKSELRAAVKAGDAEHASHVLHQHILAKPKMPDGRRTLYSDVTIPALLGQMSQNGESAVLQSSEGATILSGGAATHLPHLCSMWSGESICVDRATTESFILECPRLTTAIMIQPAALNQFLANRGDAARGIGYLARFLVCAPPSMQGQKVAGRQVFTAVSNVFEERLEELLCCIEDRLSESRPRHTLKLDHWASLAWMDYFNLVERCKRHGECYFMAPDHAARLAENAARVAALIHLFDGHEGDINVHTVNSAIQICGMLSRDFMRVFVPPPIQEQWASLLNEYFHRFRSSGIKMVKLSDLMKTGPKAVRKRGDLEIALQVLEAAGHAKVYQSGRTQFVDVMPWG